MGTGVTTSICLPEETQVTYSPTCACVFFNKQFVVNIDGVCQSLLKTLDLLLSYSNGKVSVTHTLERVAVAKQLLL